MPPNRPLEHEGDRKEGSDAPNDKAVLVSSQVKVHSHENAGPQQKEFHQEPGSQSPYSVAENVGLVQEWRTSGVEIRGILADTNGPSQKFDRNENAGTGGDSQQGNAGAQDGLIVGKPHVGRQDGSRNRRHQSKEKEKISQYSVGSRGGAGPGVGAHKIQEISRASENWNGAANDVKVNPGGGILFRKGLVQLVLIEVGLIVKFVRVDDRNTNATSFVAEWPEWPEGVEGMKARCVFVVAVPLPPSGLPKELSLQVGHVLLNEACWTRGRNGRAKIPDLEIPSVLGTLVSVVLVDSLDVTSVLKGNCHEDPDWERLVGKK